MNKENQPELDMEIDNDPAFQKRAWRVEKFTWAALGLIIVLAMLGLFGTGPLSSATAGDTDTGISVSYERFVRHDGEASLEIRISPDQVVDGEVELWISTDYLGEFRLDSNAPMPDEERPEGDRQVFVFLAEDPDGPLTITFTLSPNRVGRFSGEMGIVDGPSVAYTQISYP